ncbi:MAG: hypothetical protein WCE90_10175 [Candidatus Zixiibacteriota bacterium]
MIGERRRLPPKTCWVTYGLQGLSTEKFLKVVQRILDGKLMLLGAHRTEPESPQTIEEYFLGVSETEHEMLKTTEGHFFIGNDFNPEYPEVIEEDFVTQI